MSETTPECPRCGAAAGSGAECPRCGVVLAKARLRSVPATPAASPLDPRQADRGWWHFPVAMTALIAGGLYLLEPRRPAPARSTPAQPRRPRAVAARRPEPPEPRQLPTPGEWAETPEPAATPATDAVVDLALPTPVVVISDPELEALWRLLQAEDWYGAEAAARALVEKRPRDADAWCALTLSLLRQDRPEDALRTVRQCGDSGLAQGIERQLATAARSEEHRVAHFHVRYDGEVHEEIARDVLRALDSGYARLVSTLGVEPRRPIPVVLLSKEAYVQETGTTWSVGQYSHGAGLIRLKVRGLTMTPAFEETVVHELAHAFLGDLTHDRTPLDLNEGLAQYVSGERIGWGTTSPKDAEQYPWKRFYDDSLSFTEYLVGQRGVSGVVEALTKLGETGNENGSFRQVFGDDLGELRRKWALRRRQLAGTP